MAGRGGGRSGRGGGGTSSSLAPIADQEGDRNLLAAQHMMQSSKSAKTIKGYKSKVNQFLRFVREFHPNYLNESGVFIFNESPKRPLDKALIQAYFGYLGSTPELAQKPRKKRGHTDLDDVLEDVNRQEGPNIEGSC